MAKKQIVSQYDDSNIVLVLPKANLITQRPETIYVYFDCEVRNLSLVSKLSNTSIAKEDIALDTVSIPKYGHYKYNANKFPNNITETLHEVSFDYYFTDRQLAYLTLSYEKNPDGDGNWVSGSTDLRFVDYNMKRNYEFDNTIGTEDM